MGKAKIEWNFFSHSFIYDLIELDELVTNINIKFLCQSAYSAYTANDFCYTYSNNEYILVLFVSFILSMYQQMPAKKDIVNRLRR